VVAVSDSGLSTYDELAEVLDSLPLLCREKRRRDGISMREAARQMGVSLSVVNRMEAGEGLNLSSARSMLQWLGEVPVP